MDLYLTIDEPHRKKLTTLTILVIEDDRDNQLLLKYALNMFGYNYLMASDAKTGLSLARKYQPDLILLDIVLTKVSGLQVASRLKSDGNTQDIPLIAVTALTREEEQRLIFATGCDAYLGKPYLLDELRLAIESQLPINNLTF